MSWSTVGACTSLAIATLCLPALASAQSTGPFPDYQVCVLVEPGESNSLPLPDRALLTVQRMRTLRPVPDPMPNAWSPRPEPLQPTPPPPADLRRIVDEEFVRLSAYWGGDVILVLPNESTERNSLFLLELDDSRLVAHPYGPSPERGTPAFTLERVECT